ncbi:MAG: SAM-dependent DNA methyltransferase, partial [Selenomonas sp.]|nr:SAM-dependent DNA methyltransferase [Selenomonas sp.]
MTEKEVTVDAAGKVTEESEAVAVTTEEQDKKDTSATTDEVADVPSAPEQEESQAAAEEADSTETVEIVDETVEVEKPSRPITTEDFSNLDFTADMSTTSGKRKVFERNMAAIRTVKRLEEEEREATPEELKVLKSFSGFGGLPEAFDRYNTAWQKEYNELRNMLTDSEYSSARASTLNVHFTPPELIRGIYKGLEKRGFAGGNVLEPSCGNGRFLENMPEGIREASNIHGVELDPITARIASHIYTDATISNQPFERTTYADG